MSDLRINLLFGFLGSGKTTLLRRILGERAGERKMAVIVNEFGDVGVDGEVISGSNVNLVELTSGCLCCTLRGSLMSAVEELREKAAVEQIVVEATGVASPGDMLEDLNESRIARQLDVGPLITVVDAPKFTRLRQMLGEFYEEQVENADVLVLNKIDLATPGELDEAKAVVREINPDAVLLFAEQGDTDLALLLDGPESELLAQVKAEAEGHPHYGHDDGHGHGHEDDDRHDHHGDGHDHDHHGHAHAAAESFVMDASGDFSREGLAAAFASLPANVWRSKGFLTIDGEPSLLQFTMGQLEIGGAPARERPYLVVIGEDLDRPAVESALLAARMSEPE
jgi:G3E family GTPase